MSEADVLQAIADLSGQVTDLAEAVAILGAATGYNIVLDPPPEGQPTPLTLKQSVAAIKAKTDTIGGAGAITWTYTVTEAVGGAPIADADVWVTSDIAGTNVVATGETNASGVVTFYLDAGTYYVWRHKYGYDFTNPDTEVVA